MSKVIYKYPLVLTDHQTVALPAGAQILSVKEQHRQLQLWALVDKATLDHTTFTITIVGTGNPIYEGQELGTFVDTVISDPFVWHVFAS